MTERIRTLLTFLAADPGDTFSRFALAMEHRKEGELEAAVQALEEVLRRDPSYVGAYYHLGKLKMELGHTDEAKAALQRGLEVAEAQKDAHSGNELRQALAELEID